MESVSGNLGSGNGPRSINEERLELDSRYRYSYVTEFLGFSEDDEAAITTVEVDLVPRIPDIVDRVFDKLLSYDSTLRHVFPTLSEDCVNDRNVSEDFHADSEVIDNQKRELRNCLQTLITASGEQGVNQFIDSVGNYCTKVIRNTRQNIPHVQMDSLMGLVSDFFKAAIFEMKLERDLEIKTVRALGKLFWVQNNLLSRHYGY